MPACSLKRILTDIFFVTSVGGLDMCSTDNRPSIPPYEVLEHRFSLLDDMQKEARRVGEEREFEHALELELSVS